MIRYEHFMARLAAHETIMIDGGTGTEVERRGVPQLPNAWNGGGALSHPDILRKIHMDYIGEGAEIVISNTFATARHLIREAGCPELFEDYNRRGVELAVEAREITGRDNVLVAGGISHWSFTGHLPDLADLKEGVEEQSIIMKNAGADLIMLEMMIEIPRMLAVLEGCRASGLPVWVGLSCERDDDGMMRLLSGERDVGGSISFSQGEPLQQAIHALDGQDIPLLSIMHTDVNDIADCLDIVDQHWNGYVGVYAHSGTMIKGQWTFNDTISPEGYAEYSRSWLNRKIDIIGGCCGIRPDHICHLREIMPK